MSPGLCDSRHLRQAGCRYPWQKDTPNPGPDTPEKPSAKNNKYYLEFVSVILFPAVWTELMVNSLSFRSSFGKMSYTKQVTKAWCSFPPSYIIPPDICTVEVEARNGDGSTKSDITSWNLDHIGEWLMTSVSLHRKILPLPPQNRLGV